MRITKQELE
jgi:chromosome segregation ATPase